MWYLQHPDPQSVEQLRVRNCPLNEASDWRRSFRTAVESELQRAQRDRLQYVELGGWAVDPSRRHSGEGLLLALAGFSLGRAFGGALGLTTATVRHDSSTILRRLGGTSLGSDGVALPPYYDPRYRCEMELLRFDSRTPNPKYAPVIDLLRSYLEVAPVMRPSVDQPTNRQPASTLALPQLLLAGGTAA
jgi:hypothetical protein